MIPYTGTADLLELLLPVDAGNAPSTVRRHTLRVGQRLDGELHEAADATHIECSKADTDPVTVVGLDSVSKARSPMALPCSLTETRG